MRLLFLRRVAVLLIALFGFAQASIAFAACPVERGSLAQVMAPTAHEPCGDCAVATEFLTLHTNRCVAHCTADLLIFGQPAALVHAPVEAQALLVPCFDSRFLAKAVPEAPPPSAPPLRILLHSFLI